MTQPNHIPSIGLPPGRYRFQPAESSVHYTGKHMFGLGTVHATFAVREGGLVIEDAETLSEATIVVDAASFKSDNAKRDKDIRSSGFLDVENHPDIVFSASSMTKEPHGWLVPGAVTAHGQTVPVDLHLDRITPEGANVRVHGSASHLDRTAFGVTAGRGMVGRYLDLEIDALATLS